MLLGFGLVAAVFYFFWEFWTVFEVWHKMLPSRVKIFLLTTLTVEFFAFFFTLFVGYKFFWKKRAAQFWMIAWLWINVALAGLVYWHALSVPEIERFAAMEMQFGVSVAPFIAGVWTLYLLFSKKVRKTFVC